MELTQYFSRLLRWWWLIALSTVIAAGASFYVSLQQPRIYQTSTTVMVGQVIQKANPTGSDFALPQLLAESYAQMANLQPILQATIDSLELGISWQGLKGRVVAIPVPRTQLLAITVKDTSPERAVAIADEIAYQLILQSPSSPENEQRLERGQFVQDQLNDLETKIETAKARVVELETELESALSARKIQSLQTEISSLESLINNWRQTYTNLLNFLQGGNSPNYLTVIEPAQLPYLPVSPNMGLNVLLAAAVGFTLAAGAALLLEYLDDAIKSADDLDKSLGITHLGSIISIKGDDYQDKLITTQGQFSPMAETYRLVRTNLQFAAVDRAVKSIMVSSSQPEEGKSLTAANLGIIMAQANLKTIIVDTDLRRPMMHKFFKVSNTSGLTDLLRTDELNVERFLKQTSTDNLQVITSSSLPPNPSEMLGSQRMSELLDKLNEIADVIILDTPPLLAVTDGVVLSRKTDGVLLVIHTKRTRRGAVKEAIDRLNHAGANILGALLNQVTGKHTGKYYHAQYYSYSQSQAPNQTKAGSEKREGGWRRFFGTK